MPFKSFGENRKYKIIYLPYRRIIAGLKLFPLTGPNLGRNETENNDMTLLPSYLKCKV